MKKFLFTLILVSSTLVFVESGLLGQLSPWHKIDSYLKAKSDSLDIIDNLKLAEIYLIQERQQAKVNYKLVDSLELFVSFKQLTKDDVSCDSNEKDIFKSATNCLNHNHNKIGVTRVKNTIQNIISQYRSKCANILYQILTDRLKQSNVQEKLNRIDIFMKDLILDEAYPNEYIHDDNEIPDANILLGKIIDDFDFKLNPKYIGNVKRNCEKNNYWNLADCIYNSCSIYNKEMIDIFQKAATLGISSINMSNTRERNEFFFYWAKTTVCELINLSDVEELERAHEEYERNNDYYSHQSSSDGYSGGGGAITTGCAMGGR